MRVLDLKSKNIKVKSNFSKNVEAFVLKLKKERYICTPKKDHDSWDF